MLSNIKKPNRLVDRAISLMTLPNQDKQEILEEVNIKIRVDKGVYPSPTRVSKNCKDLISKML